MTEGVAPLAVCADCAPLSACGHSYTTLLTARVRMGNLEGAKQLLGQAVRLPPSSAFTRAPLARACGCDSTSAPAPLASAPQRYQ